MSDPARKGQTEEVIRIENLHKSFGDARILTGLSFSVSKGEIVSIIGPSGAGKTTLLRSLNWLEKPEAGTVTIAGCSVNAASATKAAIRALRSKSSMVFQNYNLFKNKTVLQNVTESLLIVKKMDAKHARDKAMAILEQVGMEDKAGAYPSYLSGGQQQRTGIARALAVDPRVMLFDEPTSALDPEWVSEVLDAIVKIAGLGMTMLIVSHEMRFVSNVASRVLFLDGGLIIEDGPPDEVFHHPVQERTRQFLEKTRENL
jgi:ABC-type polar amino acid transport system ATPase subunit